MSDTARILLALDDAAHQGDVERAVRDSGMTCEVVACHDERELADAFVAGPVSLVLASPGFAGDVFPVLEKLAVERALKSRTAILFDDARDPRRRRAAEKGHIDFVNSGQVPDPTLSALVARLVSRDRLESRLDATTVQYQALVDNSTDGIYILQGPRFVWANTRFESMVGFSLSELTSPGVTVVSENLIAPESRPALAERQRRIKAGLAVEPRYEFVALRKDGSTFDAQVSISYIQFQGAPAALGIMQDITERKRFEAQLVRKNRELALVNEISAAVNGTVEIGPLLDIGCRRAHELLRAAATGIAVVSGDGATLELRTTQGLDDETQAALEAVPLDGSSLLASAVRSGTVFVVDDLQHDPRVGIARVKSSTYRSAIVVPVRADTRALGALFVFGGERHEMTTADQELMLTIGALIGTALEKARLFEQERAAVQRLTAVDEIALAVASQLRAKDVADTVAGSVQRLFGATFVMIAELDEQHETLLPLSVRDAQSAIAEPFPIPRATSLLGLALDDGELKALPLGDEDTALVPAADRALRAYGVGFIIAVPALTDGSSSGGLLLGFPSPTPPDDSVFAALRAIGTHVAVALKNASLFAARERALDELKRAQDKLLQSERLRALGELAAGVAHDFNNVLGAILGRAQLIRATAVDEKLKKHAEIIEKAASDGAETVRRIQEIGRQETTDDFVVVDLTEIVRDVAEMTQPKWRDLTAREGRPVALDVVTDDGPVHIRGNPSELREVLINLVHNAVDAMPQGGHVTLGARIVDESWCEVTVHDDGTGIPEPVRQKVFEPFFTTKGDRGTGLGLAVSFSIVGRHDGELRLDTSTDPADHGTTFTLAFPRVDPPAAEREAPARPAPAPPLAERGAARILVIDDEENIRDILDDILTTGGYEVVTAGSGDEGLALLAQTPCDMVFTDLGLPGMNGYEVAAAIRARFPTVPVGLVTGWGATLDHEKAKHHGIDVILSKPFKFDQVLALVGGALHRR